jgi:hypothetical protein
MGRGILRRRRRRRGFAVRDEPIDFVFFEFVRHGFLLAPARAVSAVSLRARLRGLEQGAT